MRPDAVFFDLDGLLIDSEPLWVEAEQSVFGALGMALTEQDCAATTGMRTDEVVRHWYGRFGARAPVDTVVTAIVDHMVAAVSRRSRPLPGAVEAIDVAATLERPLGVVSSSPRRLIDAALRRLGTAGRFAVVVSAENEEHGKPHPAVYLTAASRLGVQPHRCVAIEDSPNGVQAAKRAGMRCIAVPAPAHRAAVTAVADLVLDSLSDLSPDSLQVGR